MKADNVRGAEKFLFTRIACMECGFNLRQLAPWRRVNDAHPKRMGTPRDRLTDPPETADPEGLTSQLHAIE